MSLRIQEVEISNVKGIAHAILKPGTLTVIRGGNGAGKSSILDAINCIFEGGHNPTLIRTGEEQARVTMTLSDGVTIEKLTTLRDSYLKITTADGMEVKKPKSFVESLASSFAFDPIAFMTATPKDRLKFLLEAMPVEFGIMEIAAVLPDDGSLRELLPKTALDLAQFGAWLEQIRERRKIARSESETIAKTCRSLKGNRQRGDKGHRRGPQRARGRSGASRRRTRNRPRALPPRRRRWSPARALRISIRAGCREVQASPSPRRLCRAP